MAKRKRSIEGLNFTLEKVEALTENQKRALESENSLVMHGSAGTGKTFLSFYIAFRDILEGSGRDIVIIRSAVPTREMGFLPGTEQEKSKVYEEPYYKICNELFSKDDAYEILKAKDIVTFMTTSFIRGLTLENTTVIVDEAQNFSFHELDSVITRIGENCKVMVCGDFFQSDLLKEKEREGLRKFLSILSKMRQFDSIEFGLDDIVRSDFVKDYLILKHSL